MKHYIRINPDGTVLALWQDQTAPMFRKGLKAVPHRASRIEVIEQGPDRGLFFVDFSPLFDCTGNEFFRGLRLPQAFTNYEDARAAEVAWLAEHYVRSLEASPPHSVPGE